MKTKYSKPNAQVVKLDLDDDLMDSQMLTGSVNDKNGNYNGHIENGGTLDPNTPWGAKKHDSWGYDAWDDDDDNNN